MVDVTVSTKINRPVDQVFAFVADMENEPQWHTDALEVKRLSGGQVGIGTSFQVQFKPSPMGAVGGDGGAGGVRAWTSDRGPVRVGQHEADGDARLRGCGR